MTPANPDALAFRDDLVRAISNGSFGKHYEAANAFMASHVAPILADLQRVTAERDAEYHRANKAIIREAAAEARAAQLQAEVEALRAALEAAEACLSIVPPRSDTAEYLRTLGVVRTALARAATAREGQADE